MKIKTTLFLLFSLPLMLVAQTTFTATVDKKTVGVNESLTLVFKADGEAGNFNPPYNLYNNFRVSGPSTGSQMSFINGKRSSSTSWTYTIKPKTEGTFLIAEATVTNNGKIYRSKPIEIKVVPASERKTEANSPEAKAKKYSTLKVLATPRTVYVGQPVSVIYKAFNKSGWDFKTLPEELNFSGFTKENFKHQPQAKVETIDGVRQNTIVLNKFLLFPQKAQVFTGQRVELNLTTAVPTGRRDMFGQPEARWVEHTISTRFPKIIVKPLPKGAPISFTGAVGTFNFKVSLSRDELKADESATLTIAISGKGNTKFVMLPQIKIPDDLETYDPKYSEKTSLQTYGYKGTKKEEYLLIPRYKGEYKIPAIAFTYFDPKKEEYITIQSEPLSLTVLEGPENTAQNNTGKNGLPINKNENIQSLGTDILFIKTGDTTLSAEPKSFYDSVLFYVLGLIGTLGLVLPWLIFGVGKKLKKLNISIKSPLDKAINKHLKLAAQAQGKNNSAMLLENIDAALLLSLEKATQLNKVDLNKIDIKSQLPKKGIKKEVIDACLEVLNKIEMARFAPMQKTEESQLLESTRHIINTLNKNIS